MIKNKIIVSGLMILLFIQTLTPLFPVGAVPVFEDGFETGNFSLWDAETDDSGSGVEVVSTGSPHHGTYHYQLVASAWQDEYIDKDFGSSNSEVYIRFYFKLSSLTGAEEIIQVYHSAIHNDNRHVMIQIDDTDGFILSILDSSSVWHHYNWGDGAISTGTYYTLEINVPKGSSATCKLWVNGVEKVSQTHTLDDYNPELMRLGTKMGDGESMTAFFDCLVVDVSYIGVESGPDSEDPEWSSCSTTTTLAGNLSTFKSYWTDNVELDYYIFSTNNTGSWVNDTAVSFGSVSSAWANVDKTLHSTIGIRVEWKVYANDTSDNWNTTDLQYLITTVSQSASDPTIDSVTFTDVSSSNMNNTLVDVNTEYWVSAVITDDDDLTNLVNITWILWDEDVSSDNGTDYVHDHYTFLYNEDTDGWSEIGPDPTGDSHLVVANCTDPASHAQTSGTFRLAFKLHKTARKEVLKDWHIKVVVFDEADGFDVSQALLFGVNFYSELTVVDATHVWNVDAGDTNETLDTPADGNINITMTCNAYFDIQAKGDGNLISGGNNIPLENVRIHRYGVTTSISLSTSWQNIGMMSGETWGENLKKHFVLWLSVPPGQAGGSYTYTLSIQIAERLQEDYTGFTEVDPSSDLVIVNGSFISVTNLEREEDAYIYKDYGEAYFSGDWKIAVDLGPTTFIGTNDFVFWALWNGTDSNQDLISAGEDGLFCYFSSLGRLYVAERYDGTTYTAYRDNIDFNKPYYINVWKDGSTLRMGVSEDKTRATYGQSAVLTLHADLSYRYLYAVQGETGAGGTVNSSVSNLAFRVPRLEFCGSDQAVGFELDVPFGAYSAYEELFGEMSYTSVYTHQGEQAINMTGGGTGKTRFRKGIHSIRPMNIETEAWFYITEEDGYIEVLEFLWHNSTNNPHFVAWVELLPSDDQVKLRVGYKVDVKITASYVIDLHNWYHVRLYRNLASGEGYKVFINNEEVLQHSGEGCETQVGVPVNDCDVSMVCSGMVLTYSGGSLWSIFMDEWKITELDEPN